MYLILLRLTYIPIVGDTRLQVIQDIYICRESLVTLGIIAVYTHQVRIPGIDTRYRYLKTV